MKLWPFGKPKQTTKTVIIRPEPRADYDMSRENRFIRRRTGLAPRGGRADYHYRTEIDYYQDIEKARDMDRNDSIVGQCITRAVDNIVQGGFSLDPQTGDKAIDERLWTLWQEWAGSSEYCDIAGEFTFHDFEMHAMRSVFRDGDCVILGTDDGSLQFLEAHCIQTSTRVENTFLGVTKDDYERRIAYWVMQDDVNPQAAKEQARRVDVRDGDGIRNLFHVYNPKRMSQTRGVTALAPIFSTVGMLDDIQFAKLVQQQVASCFAIFRQRSGNGSSNLPTKAPNYGNQTTEVTTYGTRYLDGVAPGMEIIGEPGEELKGFSPDMPSSGYFEQVSLVLQTIGINLGLPLCLVLMDGKETNFSGWRGAVDEARKGFKSHQVNLVNRLHRPVYEWKLSQWLADDEVLQEAATRPELDLFRHKWNAPRWAYIDPVGDAQGDALRLQNGLTSPRRVAAEHGDEFEELSDERIADMVYHIKGAKRAAMEINKEFADQQPVSWREIANMPMPTGLQMTMQDPNAVPLKTGDAPNAA